MLRVVIETMLLFLAPAALYVGFEMLIRRTGESPRQVLDRAPLVALFFAGATLMAVVLFAFGTIGAKDEGAAGRAYEPPTYKDGVITPGRVK